MVMRDRGDERLVYSPMALEADQDNIDYFVPAAYSRRPLPLREACVRHIMDIDASGNVISGVTLNLKDESSFRNFGEEEKPDRKRALLKGLVGQPEYSCSLSSATTVHRPDTAASRLSGTHCNASHIKSPELLTQLISLIMSSRTNPVRESVGCIASIDMSHTALGAVGPEGPPLCFDPSGNPQRYGNSIHFFPDEKCKGRKKRQLNLNETALRSLALTYIAPLLWVSGLRRFHVTVLVCRHCCLEDPDARALAHLLRKRSSCRHMCMLKHIDLSYNHITDDGAGVLKKALKYNRRVETLILVGNKGTMNTQILETIERRLERNREGRHNWTVLQHLKWMLRGH